MSLQINIQKSYKDFKLDVNLQGDTEVIGILGNSGCGKSLTLKCIAGIETPDAGSIIINGRTVFDSKKGINLPPQQRQVGYLFQNYALFPTMTVWDNIASVIKKPKSEKLALVTQIIKSFELESIKNLYPGQISGGQQQRVALGRMLVSDPTILLLDEPFSALDTNLKWTVEQEIASVLENFSGTTIFVSHDRAEAYRLSNKIAIMDSGKIECVGSRQEVFDSPKTLAAALLTGCKNISNAKKLGQFEVEALDWGITLQVKTPVPDSIKHIAIRSHHLKIIDVADKNEKQENIFTCKPRKIVNDPFKKTAQLKISDNAEKMLQMVIPKGSTIDKDSLDIVNLHIPPDRVILI